MMDEPVVWWLGAMACALLVAAIGWLVSDKEGRDG